MTRVRWAHLECSVHICRCVGKTKDTWDDDNGTSFWGYKCVFIFSCMIWGWRWKRLWMSVCMLWEREVNDLTWSKASTKPFLRHALKLHQVRFNSNLVRHDFTIPPRACLQINFNWSGLMPFEENSLYDFLCLFISSLHIFGEFTLFLAFNNASIVKIIIQPCVCVCSMEMACAECVRGVMMLYTTLKALSNKINRFYNFMTRNFLFFTEKYGGCFTTRKNNRMEWSR